MPGGSPQLAVAAVEGLHGLGQFLLEVPHLGGKLLNPVLANEPDAGFRKRQAQRLPVGDHLAANGSDCLEGRVGNVQQPLPGREKLRLGAERLGGFGLLLDSQRFAGAEPAMETRTAAIAPRNRCAGDVAVWLLLGLIVVVMDGLPYYWGEMRVVSATALALAPRDSYECAARTKNAEKGPETEDGTDKYSRADHGESTLGGRFINSSHTQSFQKEKGDNQTTGWHGCALRHSPIQAGRYVTKLRRRIA